MEIYFVFILYEDKQKEKLSTKRTNERTTTMITMMMTTTTVRIVFMFRANKKHVRSNRKKSIRQRKKKLKRCKGNSFFFPRICN